MIVGRAGGTGAADVGDGGEAETKIVHQFEVVSSEQQMRLEQIESTKRQQDGIIGERERARERASKKCSNVTCNIKPHLPSPPALMILPAGEIGNLVDGLHDRAERMNDEVTVQSTMIQNLEVHIDHVQEKLDGVSGSLDETLKAIRGSDHSESASLHAQLHASRCSTTCALLRMTRQQPEPNLSPPSPPPPAPRTPPQVCMDIFCLMLMLCVIGLFLKFSSEFSGKQ